MYKNDNLLGPIIEDLRRAGKITKYKYGPQSSRFGVSADEWEEHIKPALAEKLGLEISQLRLERAIEVDVIPQLYPYMPRKDDGNSNTWVWYGEYFEDRGHLFSSDDFFYSSLGLLYYDLLGFRQPYKSVRPLAVLWKLEYSKFVSFEFLGLGNYFQDPLFLLILILILAAIGWWVWRHIRKK